MTPTEACRIVAVLVRNVETDAARVGVLLDDADEPLAEVAAALRLALQALEEQAKETATP